MDPHVIHMGSYGIQMSEIDTGGYLLIIPNGSIWEPSGSTWDPCESTWDPHGHQMDPPGSHMDSHMISNGTHGIQMSEANTGRYLLIIPNGSIWE